MRMMMKLAQLLMAVMMSVAASAILAVTPVSARGGAAHNIMASHGYQRALKESRERYARQYYGQPYLHAPRVYPARKWRHRHWRHRR